MNILSGIQLLQKRRAAKAGLLATDATKLAAVGLVSSISDAIRNKDAIKTRKTLEAAFSKISAAARSLQREQAAAPTFDDNEKTVLSAIGDAVKSGIVGIVKYVGKKLFTAFYKGVQLVVTPIFRIFCNTVSLVFRTILSNPYTLAATALIGAALASYKLYRVRDESLRGEAPTASDPDIVGTETPAKEGKAGTTRGAPGVTTIRDVVIDAAKRNGVPTGLALKIAGAESSYDPAVRNRTGSSAKGLFQFIDKTWTSLGGAPGEQFDPHKNADLGTRYLRSNIDHLKKALGRDPTYHEVYAAHFFGPSVARMLVNIDLSAPIEKGLSKFQNKAQVATIFKLNPYLKGKTVGQVMEFFKKKVGDTQVAAGLAADHDTAQPEQPVQKSVSTGNFMLPAAGVYSSEFGPRWGKHHDGIDIANAIGTPIYAADAGLVVVSSTISLGYGTRIDIRHDNGYTTRYGHSNRLFVREGERVQRGQIIAEMGNRGRSTGPHLHFEVLTADAKPVDPATVLPGLPVARSKITSEQVAMSKSSTNTYIRVDGKLIALKD